MQKHFDSAQCDISNNELFCSNVSLSGVEDFVKSRSTQEIQ